MFHICSVYLDMMIDLLLLCLKLRAMWFMMLSFTSTDVTMLKWYWEGSGLQCNKSFVRLHQQTRVMFVLYLLSVCKHNFIQNIIMQAGQLILFVSLPYFLVKALNEVMW